MHFVHMLYSTTLGYNTIISTYGACTHPKLSEVKFLQHLFALARMDLLEDIKYNRSTRMVLNAVLIGCDPMPLRKSGIEFFVLNNETPYRKLTTAKH